jgi:hypothetical protein
MDPLITLCPFFITRIRVLIRISSNNSVFSCVVTTINSHRNKILESVIHYFNSPVTFNCNMPTRDTQRNNLLLPLTFISLQYCLIRKLFLNYRYIHVCTTIVVPFIYFYTLVCLIFIFIFVSILILQNSQNSMLLYDCIYFVQDNLNSSF